MGLKEKVRIKAKITVILVCLSIFAITAIFVFFVVKHSNYEKVDLENGWTIQKNGSTQVQVNINDTNVGITDKNETLIMSYYIREIPKNPMLVFETYHTAVNVYLNNECIYKYGVERKNEGKNIGSGFHHVNLPEDCVGSTLTIGMRTNDNNPFSKMEPIYIVNSFEYAYGYICKNIVGIAATFVMLALGIISMIIVLFLGVQKKNIRKILYIGAESFTLGLWMQCYLGYIGLLSTNLVLNAYMEHFSLYMLSIPLMLYYYESVREGLLKRCLLIGIVSNIIFVIGVFILNETKILHFNVFVSTYRMLAIIYITMIIIAVFSNNMENKKARFTMRIGVVLLSSALVIEQISYTITKYIERMPFTLITVGGFAYITCALVSYIFFITESIDEIAKKNAIKKLAYTDKLTGVSNRQRCEERMHNLDKNNIKNFAIINFDLNWLKKINDNKGHVFGDRYICDFASLLMENAPEGSMVGRMGGDEFIIIMEKVAETDVDMLLNELNVKSGNGHKPEERDPGDGISFAYGYALSNEQMPLSTQKAFEIADKKMYACKEQQKVGRK